MRLSKHLYQVIIFICAFNLLFVNVSMAASLGSDWVQIYTTKLDDGRTSVYYRQHGTGKLDLNDNTCHVYLAEKTCSSDERKIPCICFFDVIYYSPSFRSAVDKAIAEQGKEKFLICPEYVLNESSVKQITQNVRWEVDDEAIYTKKNERTSYNLWNIVKGIGLGAICLFTGNLEFAGDALGSGICGDFATTYYVTPEINPNGYSGNSIRENIEFDNNSNNINKSLFVAFLLNAKSTLTANKQD